MFNDPNTVRYKPADELWLMARAGIPPSEVQNMLVKDIREICRLTALEIENTSQFRQALLNTIAKSR